MSQKKNGRPPAPTDADEFILAQYKSTLSLTWEEFKAVRHEHSFAKNHYNAVKGYKYTVKTSSHVSVLVGKVKVWLGEITETEFLKLSDSIEPTLKENWKLIDSNLPGHGKICKSTLKKKQYRKPAQPTEAVTSVSRKVKQTPRSPVNPAPDINKSAMDMLADYGDSFESEEWLDGTDSGFGDEHEEFLER